MNYGKEGFVSFWLGKINSRNLFEKLLEENYTEDGDLISSDFAKLFKTGTYEEDFREAQFFEKGINNLSKALNSFSYSDEFGSVFENMIQNELKSDYNAIIFLYNFQYCGIKKEVSNKKYGFIKFIGFARYDYSRNALLRETFQIFGEVPWDYETKLYNLLPDKRKVLIEKISEINKLQDLDSYL